MTTSDALQIVREELLNGMFATYTEYYGYKFLKEIVIGGDHNLELLLIRIKERMDSLEWSN